MKLIDIKASTMGIQARGDTSIITNRSITRKFPLPVPVVEAVAGFLIAKNSTDIDNIGADPPRSPPFTLNIDTIVRQVGDTIVYNTSAYQATLQANRMYLLCFNPWAEEAVTTQCAFWDVTADVEISETRGRTMSMSSTEKFSSVDLFGRVFTPTVETVIEVRRISGGATTDFDKDYSWLMIADLGPVS